MDQTDDWCSARFLICLNRAPRKLERRKLAAGGVARYPCLRGPHRHENYSRGSRAHSLRCKANCSASARRSRAPDAIRIDGGAGKWGHYGRDQCAGYAMAKFDPVVVPRRAFFSRFSWAVTASGSIKVSSVGMGSGPTGPFHSRRNSLFIPTARRSV